jgi:DNA-binding CsgD family transcriptional regulator
MYTFESKPDTRPQSFPMDSARVAEVQVEPRAQRPFVSASIIDALAYYEPESEAGYASEPLPNPFHAIFIIDDSDRIRRKNYLAQELLEDRQLFRVDVDRLTPFLVSELPNWNRQVQVVRKTGKPSFVILAGLHSRFAVGLRLRAQGDLEVHIETGLKIREEALQVFCDSTGITGSEKEVLRWVLVGLKPKAIAQIRSRSEATVRSHVKNALAKSGCSSVPELIAMVTRLPDFV